MSMDELSPAHPVKEPKSIINKIYDPYFTTKDQGKGSGLGLSIAHGIVTRLKGKINIESEEGEGSRVHSYLPYTLELPIANPSTPKVLKPADNKRILFVGDDRSIVIFGTRLLISLGYEVIGRTDSVDAFDENPDCF